MMKFNAKQIGSLADILMAAAHADGVLHTVENDTVRSLIATLTGSNVPTAIEARLHAFNMATFDLQQTVAGLGTMDLAARKEVFSLVARIIESDEVHDFDESDFIVQLANAMGASREEYAGLTVSLEFDPVPPPLPSIH
jgi:uncharacterized tellurite resistance protein B-like protein